jgi:hypothetical protein
MGRPQRDPYDKYIGMVLGRDINIDDFGFNKGVIVEVVCKPRVNLHEVVGATDQTVIINVDEYNRIMQIVY